MALNTSGDDVLIANIALHKTRFIYLMITDNNPVQFGCTNVPFSVYQNYN